MIDERPQADRITIAQIHGAAKRHAKWRELTEDERAAAVGELRELAAGRADLLAEVAGVIEGFGEGQLDEPLALQAAGLCRDAGADPNPMGEWVAEGRSRRAVASMPLMSGGLRGGGVRRPAQ
jgi:acyl-CoA reductase-like NAD-dependent aldehyde dehydrogenase